MFNPKQALQRIRRTKHEKQQVQSITEGVQPLFSSPKPQMTTQTNTNIEDRVGKLQLMVLRLTEQLTNSTQVVQKLKRQNSNLQTQVLKLEYQNSQLKSTQVYSEIRRNGSNKKFADPIFEQPQREKQRQKYKQIDRKKPQPQNTQNISSSRQSYSIQVEEIIKDIKNEPLENVLKRKQYQFRTRKPDQKQITTGNKYLRELAGLAKQYGRTMRKPVLVIKLDDADFQ